MKGFTLLETAIALLLLISLIGIVINFTAFNKDILYLKNQTKNLALAFNTVSDLSQKIIKKNSEFYCGFGFYFPDKNRYEVLAFATTTEICENVIKNNQALSKFISSNLANKNYIHKNQEINTNTISTLLLNNQLEQKAFFDFGDNQDCNSLEPPLIFMYINGYDEILFIQLKTGNWENLNINQIYVCLKKGNEMFKIKINKLGQISQIQ